MNTDEDRPYRQGDKAVFLSQDALERAGIEELSAYREALLVEVARVETEVVRKRARRDHANALFKL